MDVEKMCVKNMPCGKAAGALDNAERAWHDKRTKAKWAGREEERDMLEPKDFEQISGIIEKTFHPIEYRLKCVEEELGGVRKELDGVKGEVNGVKQELNDVRSEVGGVNQELNDVRSEVGGVNQELNDIKRSVAGVEKIVKDVQLTLENETNRNIQIIAEGHLDLSRKLDEAVKIDNEKEILKLRVNRLESELEKTKSRLSEIA